MRSASEESSVSGKPVAARSSCCFLPWVKGSTHADRLWGYRSTCWIHARPAHEVRFSLDVWGNGFPQARTCKWSMGDTSHGCHLSQFSLYPTFFPCPWGGSFSTPMLFLYWNTCAGWPWRRQQTAQHSMGEAITREYEQSLRTLLFLCLFRLANGYQKLLICQGLWKQYRTRAPVPLSLLLPVAWASPSPPTTFVCCYAIKMSSAPGIQARTCVLWTS